MKHVKIADVLCVLGYNKVIAVDYDNNLHFWSPPYSMRNDRDRIRGIRKAVTGYEVREWKLLNDPTITGSDITEQVLYCKNMLRNWRPAKGEAQE